MSLHGAERAIEFAEQQLDLILGDDKRWTDDDGVVDRRDPGRVDDQPFLQAQLDESPRRIMVRGRRSLLSRVDDELETPEQSPSAYIDHMTVASSCLLQTGLELLAANPYVLEHLLALEQVQHGKARRRAEGLPENVCPNGATPVPDLSASTMWSRSSTAATG